MREARARRPLREVHDDHVRRHGQPRARARGGRPKGTTRERILDVALDLFTEHGYDKTSLREVADALGFTKAAVYYHFERKEDILLALHMRLHALGTEGLTRLAQVSDEGVDIKAWVAVLDQFIDQVLENHKLFLFHVRNERSLEQLEHEAHNQTDHADMQEQLQRVLGNTSLPLPLRVRMAAAIGAVMGALMGSGEAFVDVPPRELAELIRDAVHDVMAVSEPTRPQRRRAERPHHV